MFLWYSTTARYIWLLFFTNIQMILVDQFNSDVEITSSIFAEHPPLMISIQLWCRNQQQSATSYNSGSSSRYHPLWKSKWAGEPDTVWWYTGSHSISSNSVRFIQAHIQWYCLMILTEHYNSDVEIIKNLQLVTTPPLLRLSNYFQQISTSKESVNCKRKS